MTGPHLSVTKLQRQTVPGAEMIALCQTITEDGSLSDFEILMLEAWLVENASAELPARDHLLGLIRTFAADGIFSEEERSELYRAIEVTLPKDLRAVVRRTRIANERAEKNALVQQREIDRETAFATARAEKDEAREVRLRSQPVALLDFLVAGVTYEGRGAIVDEFCECDQQVFLIRDRANAYSKNAVEVRISNGMQIGFVPETFARGISRFLDTGHSHVASIKRIYAGPRAPIPIVIAALYRPDSGNVVAVLESQVPTKVVQNPTPH